MKFFAYIDYHGSTLKCLLRMPTIYSILSIKRYYGTQIYKIKYISIYDKLIFIDTNGSKNS